MSSMLPDSSMPALRDRLDGIRATAAKPLKKIEWREHVGQAIQRALSLAGLTQKEGWVLLGHNDGAQLNRWIAGSERPQFDALFSIESLRQPLVVALAELAGEAVEIQTVLTIRKTARRA